MNHVRLSTRQRDALTYALDAAKLSQEARVYLFGSRTDPNATGGDVDLLVYAPGADRYELAKIIRLAYQRTLDERIDVIVVDPDHPDAEQSVFLRTVHKELLR